MTEKEIEKLKEQRKNLLKSYVGSINNALKVMEDAKERPWIFAGIKSDIDNAYAVAIKIQTIDDILSKYC